MIHRNAATQHISNRFERFNPYAQVALSDDDDRDVYAMLAVAFEVSQLRYQLTRRFDNKQHAREDGHYGG